MRRKPFWRTTPFRLAALFSSAYVLGVALLLGLVYRQTAQYLTHRLDRILTAEADLLRAAGPDRIILRLRQEASRDPLNTFGLYSAGGQQVAGDSRVTPSQLPTDAEPREFVGARTASAERIVAVRLPWGETLVVGRDTGQLMELRRILFRALAWSGLVIVLFGMAFGVLLSAGPLKRIGLMRAASDRIVAGNLSARLPTSRWGDELDELAAIVNAMMDEVERLMVQARTAGESVAHELRTPLTRLRATLEHASSTLPDAEPSRALLERCIAEADGVLARFQVLLRIAAVEAKRRTAEISNLDLSGLLDQVAELYQPLARERSIRLLVQIAPHVEARVDGELIFEAIANLLDNAIKFTPEEGEVTLRLSHSAGRRRIVVRDDGPGLAIAERSLITKRFYRSPAHRGVPGHGLGLSLVAAVVDLHGFSLSFDDAQPGLCVTIAL